MLINLQALQDASTLANVGPVDWPENRRKLTELSQELGDVGVSLGEAQHR